MGAIQDKFSRDSDYQRKMDEVEIEKLEKLAELEVKKNAVKTETERQTLELEKNKAKADFELRKNELILKFQTDIGKVQADLFQTRLKTQSSLFEKFIDYMRETLTTNAALIHQQEQLFILIEKSNDPNKSTYFMKKADEIEIMKPRELMTVGLEKVKELNLEGSTEVKQLEIRLQDVLAITDQNNHQLMLRRN